MKTLVFLQQLKNKMQKKCALITSALIQKIVIQIGIRSSDKPIFFIHFLKKVVNYFKKKNACVFSDPESEKTLALPAPEPKGVEIPKPAENAIIEPPERAKKHFRSAKDILNEHSSGNNSFSEKWIFNSCLEKMAHSRHFDKIKGAYPMENYGYTSKGLRRYNVRQRAKYTAEFERLTENKKLFFQVTVLQKEELATENCAKANEAFANKIHSVLKYIGKRYKLEYFYGFECHISQRFHTHILFCVPDDFMYCPKGCTEKLTQKEMFNKLIEKFFGEMPTVHIIEKDPRETFEYVIKSLNRPYEEIEKAISVNNGAMSDADKKIILANLYCEGLGIRQFGYSRGAGYAKSRAAKEIDLEEKHNQKVQNDDTFNGVAMLKVPISEETEEKEGVKNGIVGKLYSFCEKLQKRQEKTKNRFLYLVFKVIMRIFLFFILIFS